MDFSPTRPNPAANNILGAAVFAGTGQGTRRHPDACQTPGMADGDRTSGLPTALLPNTVIRTSYSRSFAVVTTVTGSTHNQGFSTNPGFSTQDNGVTPAFLLSGSFPAFPQPPFINPSGSNGLAIPWFQNEEAARMPEYNSWNFSIQRQLTGSMVLDVSYNGQAGQPSAERAVEHQSGGPRYLQTLGPAVLNANINSPRRWRGIPKPYPTFNGSVAQALRPYPQFSGIDTWSGAGDHSGHSTYHAGIVKVEKRYSSGLTLPDARTSSRSCLRIPTPIGSPTIRARRTSTTGVWKNRSASTTSPTISNSDWFTTCRSARVASA